ncbi:AAA family ATPase [Clostridium sp. AWRP]|uniref:AAA family ATPase n=1 Tax=Clostridium sp. AWRP TaxID=2212991 RepID=UPI00325B8520
MVCNLTGILRVAKESIFFGLNNINVCTILSSEYNEYFGFTEEEVEKTLKYYGIEANMEVNYLYRQIILEWFKESINNDKFNIMLKSLVTGDIETFEEIFDDYIIKSSSFFDISGDESEKSVG